MVHRRLRAVAYAPAPARPSRQAGAFSCFTALNPLGAKGGDRDWYGYCVDDPVNRVDAWGLEESWWDSIETIEAGLGQLWDKAPGGIGEAVSEGAKGAGKALGKTAEAYATNEDLLEYTGIALGAGALPIAAAIGIEAAPIVATTVAKNPEKVEKTLDFLSGAFNPGPPPMTEAGGAGGLGSWLYNEWSTK